MFRIIENTICPLTGNVDLSYTFQLYDNPAKQFKTVFSDTKFAERKILEMKRDYLLFTFQHYLKDCEDIYKELLVYHEIKEKAFVKLREANNVMQNYIFKNIVELIIKLEPLLTFVLPPDYNPKYNFLYSIKNELVSFSQENLKI